MQEGGGPAGAEGFDETGPCWPDSPGLGISCGEVEMKPILDAALENARNGRPVFPCTIEKKPHTEHGFKDASTDPEKIRAWWKQWPDALIGTPTGKTEFALDVDQPDGPASLAALEEKYGALPPTREQETGGGGQQFFFRMPPGIAIKNSAGKIGVNLDIRAIGGYVILPPSMHKSGTRYRWANDLPVADAPAWLIDLIISTSVRIEPTPRTGDNRPGDDYNRRGDIRPMLEKAGWQFFKNSGNNEHWTRPGKETGISGTIFDDGSFFSFTGNAPPIESTKRYSRYALYALLEHGGDWTAAARELARQGYGEITTKESPPAVNLICAATIRPEPVKWLWPGWLPLGKLSVMAGAPGTGKSSLAFAIGATVSIPGVWPGGGLAEQGDVVIWSGEDDPADTIIPRLIACGANLNRVHILGGISGADSRTFDPSKDLPALQQALSGRGVKLLIVDPVVSAVAADSHKNTEVRRSLQPLVDLATVTGCAVLGISHFSKGTAGRDPVERVTGSLAFGALARVVLATAKLPAEHGGARLLARAKSNIGPDNGGFHYHMEQIEIPGHPGIFNTRVLWGKAVDGAARDLLAAAESTDENKTATDTAAEWLTDLLSNGAMKAADVTKEAKNAGIGSKPLRMAREKIGIRSTKKGFPGCWWWSLPEDVFAEDAPKMPILPERAPSENDDSYIYNNTSFLRRSPEDALGESKMPSTPEDALFLNGAPSGQDRDQEKNITVEI